LLQLPLVGVSFCLQVLEPTGNLAHGDRGDPGLEVATRPESTTGHHQALTLELNQALAQRSRGGNDQSVELVETLAVSADCALPAGQQNSNRLALTTLAGNRVVGTRQGFTCHLDGI